MARTLLEMIDHLGDDYATALKFTPDEAEDMSLMVRPTFMQILELIDDHREILTVPLVTTVVGGFQTIYLTNESYDLLNKLQLIVEEPGIAEAPVVEDVNPPWMVEAAAPETAEAEEEEELAEVFVEAVIVTEVPPTEGNDEEAAAAAAAEAAEVEAATKTKRTRTARTPVEASKINEVLSTVASSFEKMAKDNTRLTAANTSLTEEVTQLKDELRGLRAEGSVNPALLERLNRLVNGVEA